MLNQYRIDILQFPGSSLHKTELFAFQARSVVRVAACSSKFCVGLFRIVSLTVSGGFRIVSVAVSGGFRTVSVAVSGGSVI